jgi:hypothetical protein
MPSGQGPGATDAIRDAVGALGLRVEDGPPDSGPDLVVVNPAGGRVHLEVKRLSLATVEGLAHRIDTWNARLPEHTVGILVADRVTGEARETLRAADWGWLDLRGHLHIVGEGLFIDTDVPAIRQPPGRSEPFAGHVGVEVATLLLLDPHQSATVRGIAKTLGRSVSSVSEVMASMRSSGLLTADRRPVTPDLFWALAEHWRSPQADVRSLPRPGDGTVSSALHIGFTDVENTAGWALGDSVAAAAYRAPVGIRSDYPLDFHVPDEMTLRRATRLLGTANEHADRAATVRVAPTPVVCTRRVDAAGWSDESWPLAQPLFVALDLAQDPGRGREILDGWIPPRRWPRVW